MIVKLVTEHHLELLSLKGGCRGSAESTLVKMSNCWKSHAAAQICLQLQCNSSRNNKVPCEWLIQTDGIVGSKGWKCVKLWYLAT